ncbi:MAG: glutathione S-transferase family protein [Hyphomonadaceae bacterium]
MGLRLHVFPPSPRNFKVLLAAHQLGLDFETVFVDLGKGAQRAEAFGAINPNHKAPALEHDGVRLWESNAILCYLAALRPEANLLPHDARARADALRWMFWETSTWDPAAAIIVFERVVKPLLLSQQADPARVAQGETQLRAAAGIVDAHLQSRDFLCGELSLADLALGAMFAVYEPAALPLDDFAALQRWRARIQALPGWRAATAQSAVPAAA